jgi:isochorismate synthase
MSGLATPSNPDPTSLRAVSVPLGPRAVIDPYSLAGQEGFLFAGDQLVLAARGTAAVLHLPGGLENPADLETAQEWLAAVPHTDRVGRVGARVTAFGALPFDRSAGGRLVVPELTFGQDHEGHRWATVLAADPAGAGPARLDALEAELARLCHTAPDTSGAQDPVVVTPLPPGADYARSVATAVAQMVEGTLRKVVLARCVEARLRETVTTGAALRRLHAQEPSCTIFAFPVAGGRFLGASPELLVRRQARTVTCHPLAGTVGLSGDDGDENDGAIERFLASSKDRVEHELVVEEIVAALQPRCDELAVPATPSLVRLHSIAHLGTLVEGTLRAERGHPASVLELLAALHPTPAVGGVPRPEALACIAALEPVPRAHWAGPVGWVDATGDGQWMIGIRSATVLGRTVRLTAGAGIVAGSDPQAELAETTIKLAPILDAVAPGAARLL